MSKYISQYTAQTATQSTDIYLFQRGLTYYHITNANLVTSLTSSLNLAQYLTTANAATTYVPLTRELTINGVTYDLSADRSWTISAGGDWNDALTLGRITDGVNPFVSAGDAIEWHNTTASFTTTLTNDQATAANRTVYLPKFSGQLAYSTADLTSGRVTYATTNGALTDTSLFTFDGTKLGVGIATATATVHSKGSTSDSSAYALKVDNSSSSAVLYARNDKTVGIGIGTNTYGAVLQSDGAAATAYTFIGSKSDVPMVIAGHTSSGGFFSINDNTGGNRIICLNDSTGGFGTTDYIHTGRLFGVGLRGADVTAKVHIKGSTSDSSAYALKVDNSSSTKLIYARNDGRIELYDGGNISLGTTTGIKIGIGTTDKLGFWNTTPIVQPTTAITAATFLANTSGIVDDTATFDGYTIGQVVKALRNTGLLA